MNNINNDDANAPTDGEPVDLYVYDLSQGLASIVSPAILGRHVDGVWHTSVVVYGREYFYGSQGIVNIKPGSTQLGAPLRVQRMGTTHVTPRVFRDYLDGLVTTSFKGGAYDLLAHNCNHFTDEALQFLCGARCPSDIVQQAERALPEPLHAVLRAVLHAPQQEGSGREESPEFLTLNTEVEEARRTNRELNARRAELRDKLDRRERRRRHRPQVDRHLDEYDSDEVMAEAAAVEAAETSGPGVGSALAMEAEERRELERAKRSRDPPIVYKDVDGTVEYEELCKTLSGCELSADEQQSLRELRAYLVEGEGSWALGDEFLALLARVLADGDMRDARPVALRCLAAAALREDVALLLHQDRRDHALMNYAAYVDRHPVSEQRALALFMCNLFENISPSEWLLYISEWEYNGQPMSNIRATTKVAVHSLLSEDAELREVGSALMYNIAGKEVKTVVFDEVCVELAMAVLAALGGADGASGGGGGAGADEERLFRLLRTLARLADSCADVPQLVALVGPHPTAFSGVSGRVDDQVQLIVAKIK